MFLGKDSGLRPILKKLNIPLVDHNECQRKLRTTRLNKYFKLHDSFICGSGIAGLDTCSVVFYFFLNLKIEAHTVSD